MIPSRMRSFAPSTWPERATPPRPVVTFPKNPRRELTGVIDINVCSLLVKKHAIRSAVLKRKAQPKLRNARVARTHDLSERSRSQRAAHACPFSVIEDVEELRTKLKHHRLV